MLEGASSVKNKKHKEAQSRSETVAQTTRLLRRNKQIKKEKSKFLKHTYGYLVSSSSSSSSQQRRFPPPPSFFFVCIKKGFFNLYVE